MAGAHEKKKVVIVTGGSRGIGRGVSQYLATHGWSIVVNYAGNVAAAESLKKEIEEAHGPGRVVTIKADVGDAGDVKRLFDQAEEAFGQQVDAVVHLAGIILDEYPSVAETTEQDWDRIFATNVKGTFLVSKEAQGRVASGGRIVNCSSTLVITLMPGYAAYIASKAAVEALTKVLAKELRGKNITANCVAPGPTASDLFFAGKTEQQIAAAAKSAPLERLGQPQDIAGVVKFLLSEDGAWVNGQVIPANGGAGIG